MLTELIHQELTCRPEIKRNYLGCSSIGRPCEREIYYDFIGAPRAPRSGSLELIFELGKQIEVMILDLLEESAIIVYRPNQDNNYLRCLSDELPMFQGHADAIIVVGNERWVLEIKSANAASFAKLKKEGFMRWRSQYYDQVQCYIGMLGLGNAVILVLNKDNSELYEESIKFDKTHYELLCERARRIISAKVPPERISYSPMFYLCKQCSFSKVCHG